LLLYYATRLFSTSSLYYYYINIHIISIINVGNAEDLKYAFIVGVSGKDMFPWAH